MRLYDMHAKLHLLICKRTTQKNAIAHYIQPGPRANRFELLWHACMSYNDRWISIRCHHNLRRVWLPFYSPSVRSICGCGWPVALHLRQSSDLLLQVANIDAGMHGVNAFVWRAKAYCKSPGNRMETAINKIKDSTDSPDRHTCTWARQRIQHS